MKVAIVLALWGYLIMAGGAALAARFEIRSDEPLTLAEVASGQCTISMEGRIEEGDEQRLLNVSQSLRDQRENNGYVWPESMTTTTGLILFPGLVDVQVASRAALADADLPRHDAICLNSRGGSFPESLKLIQVIAPFGYITVVDEGSECWSACAFIFLSGGASFTIGGPAGSHGGRLGEIMPFRVLHVGGDLRFHAPYFQEGRLPSALPTFWMNEKLSEALDYLREFDLYFAERDTISPETRFTRELFSAALRQFGPSRWHYVDNVGLAGLYNIRLAGIAEIDLSVSSLARVCSNVSHWGQSMMSPLSNDLRQREYDVSIDDRPLQCADPLCSVGDGHYQLTFGTGRCSVHVNQSDLGDDLLVSWSYDGAVRQLNWMSLEPWATLPHYLTLEFVSRHGSFPPFSQKPYLGGNLDEIDPAQSAGQGVMITGFWDSSPFGIFLWPSREGNPSEAGGFFAWMSADLYVQEDLRPVSVNLASGTFCFTNSPVEADDQCSVAVCEQDVGCVFDPQAPHALEGFPYLSRPIFFDRSSGLLEPFARTPD